MEEQDVRASIRAKLRTREISDSEPLQTWGGEGGRRCDLCGRDIPAGETCIEAEHRSRTYFYHPRCQTILRSELAKIDR